LSNNQAPETVADDQTAGGDKLKKKKKKKDKDKTEKKDKKEKKLKVRELFEDANANGPDINQ
jgi:hypothetical protein